MYLSCLMNILFVNCLLVHYAFSHNNNMVLLKSSSTLSDSLPSDSSPKSPKSAVEPPAEPPADHPVESPVEQVNIPDFIPTNEWQPILEGQKIPPGLHVRMDLSTGIKEAKLLDKTESSSTQHRQAGGPIKGIKMLPAPVDKSSNSEKPNKIDPNELRRLKDLSKFLFRPQGESDVIQDLLIHFKSNQSTYETITQILDALEDYCHHVDNAVDMFTMGWMTHLLGFINSSVTIDINISPWHSYSLLSEKEKIQLSISSCWILGSATQNNFKAQKLVIDAGGLSSVLSFIKFSQNILQNSEISQDIIKLYFQAQLKSIYAVSSIIRGSYLAQEQFSHLGGLDLAESHFKTQKVWEIDTVKRVDGKWLGIFGDLMTDHLVNKISKNNVNPIWTTLTTKWCHVYPNLFERFISDLGNNSYLDLVNLERFINILTSLLSEGQCQKSLVSSHMLHFIRVGIEIVGQREDFNEEDSYAKDIHLELIRMRSKIKNLKQEL